VDPEPVAVGAGEADGELVDDLPAQVAAAFGGTS